MNSRYTSLQSGFDNSQIIPILADCLKKLDEYGRQDFREEQVEEKIRLRYQQLKILETIEFFVKIRIHRTAEDVNSDAERLRKISKELQGRHEKIKKNYSLFLEEIDKNHLPNFMKLNKDKQERIEQYKKYIWSLFDLINHVQGDLKEISQRSVKHYKDISNKIR